MGVTKSGVGALGKREVGMHLARKREMTILPFTTRYPQVSFLHASYGQSHCQNSQ
jgi:hypothetical protein